MKEKVGYACIYWVREWNKKVSLDSEVTQSPLYIYIYCRLKNYDFKLNYKNKLLKIAFLKIWD